MNVPKFLSSPLAATSGVLLIMAFLALPLRKLTSADPLVSTAPPAAVERTDVPAWITLKLLTPAKSVSLRTATGTVLWQLPSTPAGDVETQTALPLEAGGLDLILTADLGEASTETALFLTIEPDELESQTRHAIGSGRIEEPLHFTWHSH